jgi:hypothetical protein
VLLHCCVLLVLLARYHDSWHDLTGVDSSWQCCLSPMFSSSLLSLCLGVLWFCRHLANYLATCKEDVALLQEVWVDADAQLLIAAGRAGGLVHATHFRCVLWHVTRHCAEGLAANAHQQDCSLPAPEPQCRGSQQPAVTVWLHHRDTIAVCSGDRLAALYLQQ